MREAAKALEFEKAAEIRDRLKTLRAPRVRTEVVRAVVVAILVSSLAVPGAGANSPAPEPPLTVGSVAKGLFNPDAPGVLARWETALKDARSEVRYAAARVVTLSARCRSRPGRAAGPGRGEAHRRGRGASLRAVILGSASEDAKLLVALARERTTASSLATALLRVRTTLPSAEHLPALLSAGLLFDDDLARARHRHAEVQTLVGRSALGGGTRGMLRTALEAGSSGAALAPSEGLRAGLASSREELRETTLVYLAVRAAADKTLPTDVREALDRMPAPGETEMSSAPPPRASPAGSRSRSPTHAGLDGPSLLGPAGPPQTFGSSRIAA